MRIEDLRLENMGGKPRVVARVIWEDSDRPAQDVFFETDEQFAEALSCNPHAFLLACVMPAFRRGEHRIKIDAEICPELREGLTEAMSWIRHWFGRERRLVQIESRTAARGASRIPERAGFFFSGGVDSLATLRSNRLNYPLDHPGSFRDGIPVFGLDMENPVVVHHVVKLLTEIANDAGINLLPVYTNERYLDDDWGFWAFEFQGAALAAVAHALNRRVTSVSISATYDLSNLGPYGSHPLIDPLFSSHDLRVRHDGVRLSRVDKTRLIADWDVALHGMRVCNQSDDYRGDQLNCGKCEKCMRTMLGLVAVGALERCRAFPIREVSEETAAAIEIGSHFAKSCYPELVAPLEARGREDLARGVEYALARFRGETGLLGPVRRFDRLFLKDSLKDSLRELKRKVVAKRAKTT